MQYSTAYGSQGSDVAVGGIVGGMVTVIGTNVGIGTRVWVANVGIASTICDPDGGEEQEARNNNKREITFFMSSFWSRPACWTTELERYTVKMENLYKTYLHNPPHLFVPNAMYIVTGSLLYKQRLLFDDKRKAVVLEILLERAAHWNWDMQAWSVLENHYHFVSQAPQKALTLESLI